MTNTTARDAKLIQYLNEAFAMEKHLETALQAHIPMTADKSYRQRLKEHLSETRRHGREVRQRVKRLGGTPETIPVPGPDVVSEAAGALLGSAEKAVARAQGPLHALRGTSPAEKQLKNAKTEYASEAREIATYRAIETLADALGDRDTVALARAIRREEERMRDFLERAIPRLTKAVVTSEIPAAERRPAKGRSSRSRTASAPKATGGSRRTTRSQSRAKASSAGKSAARAKSPTRAKSTARAKSAPRAKSAVKAR